MNSDLLSDWLIYINSNRPNEDEFGLERLKNIFGQIVTKPVARKTILVGGTNGKGTTAEYLKNFFSTAGYRVGLYTSPHLMEFNERIQIDQESIEDERIVQSFKKIDKLKEDTKLTYFDYATLASFDIFSEESLDYAIFEIGIGGKYDPVNLINSDLSIVTNIDLDHQKWLGSSVEEIGSQKAAIFKPGKISILGSEKMPKSVTKRANKVSSSYYQLNKDFVIKRSKLHWSYAFDEKNVFVKSVPYGGLSCESASSAITAFKLLSDKEIDFIQAIEETCLKGRCDVIDNFVLDVSHNPASVKNLVSFIHRRFKNIKFNAIFAAMDDKDSASIIREISPLISEWNICTIEDDRFNSSDLLSLTNSLTDKRVNKVDTVYSAVKTGYHAKTPQIVFGSFITVSEAYKALERIKIKAE